MLEKNISKISFNMTAIIFQKIIMKEYEMDKNLCTDLKQYIYLKKEVDKSFPEAYFII